MCHTLKICCTYSSCLLTNDKRLLHPLLPATSLVCKTSFLVFLFLSLFSCLASLSLPCFSLSLDMKLGENLGMALAHSYLMIGVIPGTQDLAQYFSSSRGLTGAATPGSSSSNTTSIDSLSQALDTASFNSLSIRPRERKYKQ